MEITKTSRKDPAQQIYDSEIKCLYTQPEKELIEIMNYFVRSTDGNG